MNKTPTTKEQALNSLGVYDRKVMGELARQLEFIDVSKGRRLVAKGSYMPTSLIAVGGSVSFAHGHGRSVVVDAPCVIDTWAANDSRISSVTAVAHENTALLLVDWRYRDSAMAAISRLEALSAATALKVAMTQMDPTQVVASVSATSAG